MVSRVFIVVAFLALVVPPALQASGAESDLAVSASPQFCRDPCRVRIKVVLEPHETDRALIIEADSAAYFRSSLVQLNGDSAPGVHYITFKALPAGRYEIRAMLRRTDGVEALAHDSIDVLGM